MIRHQVAKEGVAEVADAAKAMFAALEAQRPEGTGYVYYHRPGGTEFVGLPELDEGVENPLPGIDAARKLQATVAKSATDDAQTPQPLDLLGS